jgi:hypothetical protein
MTTDTVKCPIHKQDIKITTKGGVRSAVCTCVVSGHNIYAGVVVWESNSQSTPEEPTRMKLNKENDK